MAKTWLVTGCAAGFGRLFVNAIATRGDNIIATARDISSLVELEAANVKILQLDVTTSEHLLRQKLQEATDLFGTIDVLVNNAGYVGTGVWEEVNHQQTVEQFATNVFAPLNLTRALLPQFRDQGHGCIVFMSSIAAWRGVGGGGLYSSSKFALEGAVECLHEEVKSLNIETYLMVLGQFRTSILDPTRLAQRTSTPIKDYDAIVKGHADRLVQTNGIQPGDPRLAVERIIDIVRHEGLAKGCRLPLRIPLGSDAVRVMQQKCHDTIGTVQDLETLASSTDYPDPVAAPRV